MTNVMKPWTLFNDEVFLKCSDITLSIRALKKRISVSCFHILTFAYIYTQMLDIEMLDRIVENSKSKLS